eukprot:Clim_evm40s218 gene=Clim_evmTU40s218
MTRRSYAARAADHPNPIVKKLFQLMEDKETNICLSADVHDMDEILELAKLLGPHICMLKTHIDIVPNFTLDKAMELYRMSEEMGFVIFEDRKFADIGNTVSMQYSSGIYKIAEWSHITNAHTVPGPGIIRGLAKVGLEKGRGLLLLAEMSSVGNLAVGEYTEKTISMAKENKDFVIGFVSQRKLIPEDDHFIVTTPGVSLVSKGDALGQQYRSPSDAINDGSDIIIVGRGILAQKDRIEAAKQYKQNAWEAYKKDLQA